VLAAKGHKRAISELELPEVDNNDAYLIEWVYQLHGRSGASMSGLLPLSPTVIQAWAQLSDVEIHPWEVWALLYLDSVMLVSDKEVEHEKPEEVTLPRVQPVWPDNK